MKKIFLFLTFSVAVGSAQAQQLKWHTNVKEAVAISTKDNKPLLLFFTGSDWCGWCIRLQNEVLKTPEFEKWANENVVLVELDFPRKSLQSADEKKQNNELLQAFGVQGFPTVHLANAVETNGQVNFQGLGSTGYLAGGPTAWLAVADGIVKTKK